ncbi:hypothetical protein PIB30_092535, partial [Stylosanthes scabra]|nr:hypothetical protein [Stylosanthes scabra]
MGYFSAVAPGTRTLARGIFSTPSYPEKAGAPCVIRIKENAGNFGRRGREGHGGRGGGRNTWNNNNNRPQCQIYGKLGHIA